MLGLSEARIDLTALLILFVHDVAAMLFRAAHRVTFTFICDAGFEEAWSEYPPTMEEDVRRPHRNVRYLSSTPFAAVDACAHTDGFI